MVSKDDYLNWQIQNENYLKKLYDILIEGYLKLNIKSYSEPTYTEFIAFIYNNSDKYISPWL
jgi:hypothetical protein